MKTSTLGYLAASFLSALGNAAAAVALPLLILTTTGDPLATGVVAAATAVPTIAVGLAAGVVVDRANRRDIAVLSDVISALAVAAIPLVDGAIGLSLGWFIGLAIAGAVGDAPGASAREAMAPAIARASGLGLDRVLGIVQGAAALAMVAGPALAAGVIGVLGPTAVMWVTAAASGAAALAGLAVPRGAGRMAAAMVDGAAAGASRDDVGRWDAGVSGDDADRVARALPQDGPLASLRDGWRVLAGSPTLVWATVLSAGSMAVTGSLQGLVLPSYALEVGRPGLVGAVLAAFAVAAIVGALLYSALADGRRRRAWFVGGVAGALLGLILVAPLSSPTLVLVGAAIMGLAAGPLNSAIGAALVDLTPDHARGRVLATQNAFVLAAVPLGVLGAGALADVGGLRTASWAGVVVWAGLTAIAALAPALRRLDVPAPTGTEDAPDRDDVPSRSIVAAG
ncbi:MFS transporter [Demequina sp. NBRC 110054]|uniref:MFS transporter n=1 Tax=Demequina sp. NBRC 110054 TaxID=1570343 RepID=UPI000A079037|nr:MFS transporter [Demequina sp. NBRC 110054]